MNVLLISTDFPPLVGGIATYTKNIARQLALICRLTVVAPRFRKGSVSGEHVHEPFRVERVPDIIVLRELLIFYVCLRLVRQYREEIVIFASAWFPSGFIAYCLWRLFRCPYYLAAHASEFLDDRHTFRRRLKYHLSFLKLPVFENAAGIFAVSHYTADLLRSQGIRSERIHVVHNGADPHLFRPREVSQDLQRHFGVADKRVLLTVCRLDPHKGVHFAIEALSHLCREFSDLLYVVIGNGPEYNHLVRLAASLGLRDRVRFLGQVRENEVVFWYNLCDIFVMFPHPIPDRTDLIEGFGISFVEAAACSKPVVGCRFGGVTDAVKDGETGLLIEVPLQVPDIVDAIKRLLTCEELRRELGRAGRLRVEKELNWGYVAHQLFKTFREDMQRLQSVGSQAETQ